LRAVLDVNVVVSAALAPRGAPAEILQAWLDGEFEFVASELLLSELIRALAYPKLSSRITTSEATALVELIRREAILAPDPESVPETRSPDPGDDYLISLATATRAVIVSGDEHLLCLTEVLPVYSPAGFLAMLIEARGSK
jgi:putative PIN family toxin of toxin-antitoxin system